MKVAIVGYGRIAKRHHEVIQENQDELISVCDNNPAALQKAIDKDPSVHTYTSLSEMLVSEPEIETVAICTPSGLHSLQAKECMEAKKAVLIEKPMALSIQEADELIQTADKYSLTAAVCHQNRFNGPLRQIKKVQRAGEFGKISHASLHVRWNRNENYYQQAKWRGTWEMDGGVLMNQGIHGIDYLLTIMDSPVVSVFGKIANRIHPFNETEDLCTGILTFENGVLATIEITANAYPRNYEETLYLFAENGTVKIGGACLDQIEYWNVNAPANPSTVDDQFKENEISKDIYGKGHLSMYQNIRNVLQENKEDSERKGNAEIKEYTDAKGNKENKSEPLVNLLEGKKALEVILALYQSAKENKEIKLPLKENFSTMKMKGFLNDHE